MTYNLITKNKNDYFISVKYAVLSIDIKTNVVNSILIIYLIYFTVQCDFKKKICYFHKLPHTAAYSFDFTYISLYETDDSMSAYDRCGYAMNKLI